MASQGKSLSPWTKQSSMFHTHEQSGYHQDSMARMLAFKEMYAAPAQGVDSMLNKEQEKQIRNNTAALRSLLDVDTSTPSFWLLTSSGTNRARALQ